MANIDLVTWSGHLVTPQDDALVYEVATGQSGIIYGADITIKNSNTLHITAGHGIVCGRKFTIDDGDIALALSPSGELQGRIYIHLDLSNTAAPIEILTETGTTLTPVVQDDDVNIISGTYEFNLATFMVGEVAITDLVNVTPRVEPTAGMAAEALTTVSGMNHVVLKTLTVAGWQLNGSVYEQTISFTKIYSLKPIITACGDTLGSLATDAQYAALRQLNVTGDTDTNTFTFYATSAPKVAINISVWGVE